MTKPTITKIWIAGLILLVAGLIVGGIGVGLLLAYGGTFTQMSSGNGYTFEPRTDGTFWTTIGIMIVGFAVAAAGGIMQLVAWIGALVNTNQLQDKTWFVILLVGGLLGLVFGLVGLAAMVAYLIAGPDGTALRRPEMPPSEPPPSLAPTT